MGWKRDAKEKNKNMTSTAFVTDKNDDWPVLLM